MTTVYDIEVYADRYEQESTYNLECNLEQDMEETRQLLESGREVCAKWDTLMLEIEAADADRAARKACSSVSVQTKEETEMFEAWLS